MRKVRIETLVEFWGEPMTSRIIACLAMLIAAVPFLAQSASAQFAVDQRLFGTWSKDGTGEVLKVLANGDVNIVLSGQASVFNGDGAIERCTDGGSNLCISGVRMKCAFRYAFTQGVLNLQYRTGTTDLACKALSGDFRRRE